MSQPQKPATPSSTSSILRNPISWILYPVVFLGMAILLTIAHVFGYLMNMFDLPINALKAVGVFIGEQVGDEEEST